MSKWQAIKKEDMFLTEDGEINFYIEHDIDGAVYISAKIKDVLKVIKEKKDL